MHDRSKRPAARIINDRFPERDALRRDAADLDALRLAAALLKRLERERPGHSY